MCWTGKNTCKVAPKDMVVYKTLTTEPYGFLDSKRISTFRGFPWFFGEVYCETINPDKTRGTTYIKKGLHAYATISKAKDNRFGGGIYKAVIPKGTKYWENDYKEIVAEAMYIKPPTWWHWLKYKLNV